MHPNQTNAHRGMTILLLLCCSILLTACAGDEPPPTVVTEIKVERVLPPPSLLACQPAPLVPTAPVTQRDLAGYLVDLAGAGEDCRARLARVKEWTQE